MRDRAAKVLADEYADKKSLLDDEFCMEEDRLSSYDHDGSYFENRSVSNLPELAEQLTMMKRMLLLCANFCLTLTPMLTTRLIHPNLTKRGWNM